jgi:phosphoglycerate dehydrogenase-like enzyme
MKILLIPALTLPDISADDLARIRAAAGSDAEVVVTTPAEAYKHAEDAEVILGSVPRTLFQSAPKLRWVQATSSGVDAFLYPEFRDSQVVLTSEKGMVGEHLADHAFGLLLMLTRQLTTAFKLGPDAWNHRAELRRQQVELSGLTMGIIGFGSTGRAMAPREPLPPDSALWDMSNVVMTPHTAGASQYRAARNIDRFIRNIMHFRQNEPLEGVINKQLGY